MFKKIAGAVVAVPPVSVWAAVPTEVSDAITQTQTDAASVAGLMLVVVAALLGFAYMRRQMH